VRISYYPDGFGPVEPGRGQLFLSYQDAHDSKSFAKNELRVSQSSDLGLIVSATLMVTPDLGATTLSLLLPAVSLPPGIGSSAPITAVSILTFHRTPLFPIGVSQRETFTVTDLTGSAAFGPVAL
jgi:hypothetical protein